MGLTPAADRSELSEPVLHCRIPRTSSVRPQVVMPAPKTSHPPNVQATPSHPEEPEPHRRDHGNTESERHAFEHHDAAVLVGALDGTVEGDSNADHREHGEQDPQAGSRGVLINADLDSRQENAEERNGGDELSEVAVALALVLGAQPGAPATLARGWSCRSASPCLDSKATLSLCQGHFPTSSLDSTPLAPLTLNPNIGYQPRHKT